MDYGPICGVVLRRTTSPPPKLETGNTPWSTDIVSLWSLVNGTWLGADVPDVHVVLSGRFSGQMAHGGGTAVELMNVLLDCNKNGDVTTAYVTSYQQVRAGSCRHHIVCRWVCLLVNWCECCSFISCRWKYRRWRCSHNMPYNITMLLFAARPRNDL